MKYGLYHKDCEDGTMAAIILKRAIPDIYLFSTSRSWEWKELLSLKKGDEMIFVDICPPPEDLVELMKKGMQWKVIDHHITANNEMQAYKKMHPDFPVENFIYYPEKCGATAVWDYFFKHKKMPELLKFIEIGDLWKWERDEHSRDVQQYIRTICRRGSLEDYGRLLDSFNYDEAVKNGKIIYTKLMNEVAYTADRAAELDFDGELVLSVNTDHAESEVGHALAERAKNGIGVVYRLYPGLGLVKFSVRGMKGNAARKFAEKHGGGGHDQAAGFTMTIEDFCALLEKNERRIHNERRSAQKKD